MNEMSVKENDIGSVCRLCLSKDSTLLDIFHFSSVMKNRLSNIIMWCAPIQIRRHDNMPNFICRLCHTQLKKIHKFQIQIIQSDKILRRYLKQLDDFGKQSRSDYSNQKSSENHREVNWEEMAPINFNSVNKLTEEVSLKYEIKDEPTDDNSSNLTECADDTVETVYKSDCGEIVCEDSKVDASYHLKLDENKCVIEKNENFQSSNQDIPLKLEIKEEPTYNSLNLTECGNDVIETLPKSDGSGICRENSKTDSGFISENSAAESGGKGEEEKKKISVIYEKQKATEKIFHCEMCDKKFTKSRNLKVHMLTHRDTKPYQCDVCKKCFNHLGNYNHHKRIHTGEKPYQCDVCKNCFRSLNHLKIHKRTHTGEKPYQCDICKKCFSQISYFNIHKRLHTGEKPFKCDVCDKCFSQKNSLNYHKRTHTDEKPYQCDGCNKCFSQKNTLNYHKRTHTVPKPFSCDVCKKCFSQSTDLIRHMRTHTGEKPYQCDVCKKCFSNSTALNVHKRTHTGEKPYECDVCNKCFRHSHGLSNHKRTHTGDKPYQCDVCNKCFSVSWCLNVHKRTHTA